MAVEIHILSGARQGDRLAFEGRQFQAGPDPACDIFFDPERDSGIQGRAAVFRLQDDGWRVRGSGGEVLVNQRPIVGWTRLRSGDLVRMSPLGPDLSFTIVTAANAAATKSSPPAPLDVASTSPRVIPPNEHPNCRTNPVSPDARTVQPQANRSRPVWIGVGLVACLVGLVFIRSMFTTPTVIVNVSQPVVPSPVASATPPDPGNSAPEKKNDISPEPVAPVAANEKKPAAEQARSPDIAAQLGDAIFLIQVEQSGRTWPYATCVAVGPDTLLTTAREAAQLASWRAQKGFTIWVTRPAAEVKEQVQDIRVHGIYASLPKTSDDWIYFDLGLLTVGAKLPHPARLASSQDLAELEEGLPVSCFGFTHEGEKITRFDKFAPLLAPGKIKLITILQQPPVTSRVLHVQAEVPKNAYGSPIVNANGTVVGIYAEDASPPGDQSTSAAPPALKNLHYAPVVSDELVKNDKLWVPAAAAPTEKNRPDKP